MATGITAGLADTTNAKASQRLQAPPWLTRTHIGPAATISPRVAAKPKQRPPIWHPVPTLGQPSPPAVPHVPPDDARFSTYPSWFRVRKQAAPKARRAGPAATGSVRPGFTRRRAPATARRRSEWRGPRGRWNHSNLLRQPIGVRRRSPSSEMKPPAPPVSSGRAAPPPPT
nr:protein transport protein sec31 isoform X1 [Aegilops tauschii subsp. strangulata]